MTRFDDGKTRFSDRVDAYVRTRPGYPSALLEWLEERFSLDADHRIADLGAGTGILSRQLADRGMQVLAVEPNQAMRAAIEPGGRVVAVDGTAEQTTLPSGSVDGVVAAQAFHWFDPKRCAAECRRILAPGGWAALIWNDRRLRGTPFLRDYEQFLRDWGTDYRRVGNSYADADALITFFATVPAPERFDNVQRLDRDGMLGRLESSSYIPGRGHERHQAMRRAAEAMFATHERDGHVEIDYDTTVYAALL